MKIANSFDAGEIASAKNKIVFAVAFLCVAVLFWFPSLRSFVAKHPGLIGVLAAVTGEVYFDWIEEIGKHARWKKFFMALLVVSLSYELYEAAETDKEAAEAIKLAGEANKKAEIERVRADVLETNIRELAHVYGQSSNALVEATNVLQQAKGQLASAEAKLAEAKTMIKPAKERLRDLLQDIAGAKAREMMQGLRSGNSVTLQAVTLDAVRLQQLEDFLNNLETKNFISIKNVTAQAILLGKVASEVADLTILPALLQ